MKIAAIVQARMNSTRLPGKVLQEVLGKPLLRYQLERVKESAFISDLIVATTVSAADDPIAALCQSLGVNFYRGSESDVLERYYEAALQSCADIVVRLTGDCPLHDPGIIDQVIQAYLDSPASCDYVSNTLQRTFPRGLDTEVFSIDALIKAHAEAFEESDREHVTPYIYRHPDSFEILQLTNRQDWSRYRLTVDTPEDFQLIRLILEALYPSNPLFGMEDILQLLDQNKDWSRLNSHIEQKKW